MQQLLNKIIEVCTTAGTRILLAIVVWIAGRFLIRKLVAFLQKRDLLRKMEPTVASFVGNFINILLNILLILTVINILGVPMASVVTVLAAAGVAVGMSLQGALSNLAGGIMLMFFRPFSVGDYVSAGGEEGTVKGIALFYTTLLTSDNKRVMIPNGTLMNANITNYSSEGMRRVDLAFSCGKGESVQKVETLMISCLSAQKKVLKDPAPFARLTGGTDQALQFSVRVWCRTADYWDVYYDLLERVVTAMNEAGISAPAIRVTQA
jgi:small conductance mechanosensitive channel